MRLPFVLAAFSIAAASSSAQTAPPPKLSTTQRVTVTADRGLLGVDDSASSVALLATEQLQQHAGFTLDDALRQVAGFQLFRRTSSWTANPTGQGPLAARAWQHGRQPHPRRLR